jgi:putative SOS response-associated peptidase YedK
MCGRYTLATPDPGAIRDRFPIGESIEVRQRFNVASWAKSPSTGMKMINARLETVSERPAYRGAFERFRCLIVADGFYEWQRMPSGPKQPFHITRDDGALFAFAGLWSIWHAPDGSKLRTCTIITTEANSAIAGLHDRMPVILPPESETQWLDTSTPHDRLTEILAGLPARETAMTAVGLAVNDARYDGPECLAPPPEEAQAALF